MSLVRWLVVAVMLAVSLADLPSSICIRGGVPCEAGQVGDCTSDRGYCCMYELPVNPSKRCFCKPGFAGKDCQITLDDPDWLEDGQRDLKKTLDSMKNLNTNVAKNTILFIGDGMGIATVTASRIYKGQQDNKAGENTKFTFEEFPFTGLSRTFLANHQVADSAGAASSILGGQKVAYATVGVNSKVIRFDCESAPGNEITTILEWSQKEGKRTGIVSNTRVTHATPAAAYASSAERFWECDADFLDKWGNDWWDLQARENNCSDIAHQFVHTEPGKNINVMLGGGRAKFLPNTLADWEYPNNVGARKDGRNLVEEWQQVKLDNEQAAEFVWNKTAFNDVDPETTDYLFGLFERSHMKYNYQNTDDNEPSMAEMVEKAINILKRDDDGFFLLVEGGRIDHGHHAGLAKVAMDETLAFDEAIKKAVEMTDSDDTLIAVTADHSHVFTIGGYTGRGNDILGVLDTVDVEPSLDGKPRTTLTYGDGPGAPENGQTRSDPTEDDTHAWDYKQQAMVKTVEESHGGEDVPIYATGPMAHLFTGVHDQSYVAHVLAYASCVGENKEHCKDRGDKDKDQGGATCSAMAYAVNLVVFISAILLCIVF